MELSNNETSLLIALQLTTERLTDEINYKQYLEEEQKKLNIEIISLKNQIESLNALVNKHSEAVNKSNEDSIQKGNIVPKTHPYNPENIKERFEKARKVLEPKTESLIHSKLAEAIPSESEIRIQFYDPKSVKEKLKTTRKLLEPITICHPKARALTNTEAQEVWNLHRQGYKETEIVRTIKQKCIHITQPIVHQIINNESYKDIDRS